jgi:zinc protease
MRAHPTTRFGVAAAAVFLAVIAAAPRPAAQPKPASPADHPGSLAISGVETWELPNGMKVAYLGVHTAPVVTVQVWYHVGSKDEPRDRRGSAHMFEHMMFKGTERIRPEDHARHINRVGGYVNAATSEDATWYINVLPAQYLDFALKLEAERMRGLLFRRDMVDTEREVVKEEIRQQLNNPITKGLLAFFEVAYTRHPYAWTAGGTIEDLDRTSVEDLRRFYDTYYVPNNAMLVVVGDVTREQVAAAAKARFAAIERGAEPPRPAREAVEPAQRGARRHVAEAGQVGIVLAGYKIPEAQHDDIYALQVLSLILGAGDSSRLNRRLVRADRVAVQAGSQALVREDPGLFALFAAYLQPDAGAAVEKNLLDEVSRIRKTPPGARELRKAKNQIQSMFVFGLEGVAGLAEQIGTSWILTGDPGQFLRDLERYEQVTAADVQRVAQEYLDPAGLTVVVVPTAAGGN